MRIVAISDTHGKHSQFDIPDGEVVIHAGDCMNSGRDIRELESFAKWFLDLPHKRKCLVAGNHDWIFQTNQTKALSLLPGVSYLLDSGITIDGIKFWGSPWQPEFCDWAFNLPRGEPLKEKWNLIPSDTDVLITHGPPQGFGDTSVQWGPKLGCDELTKAVERVNPYVHIFGHIHGGRGWYTGLGKTTFYNVALLDEAYKPAHKPVVIDI